jgi:ElaB/YqjD/DUF883 family membrane-anchored ribosome-binding protein
MSGAGDGTARLKTAFIIRLASTDNETWHSERRLQIKLQPEPRQEITAMATRQTSKDNGTGRQASAISKNLQHIGDATKKMAAEGADALRHTATEYADRGRTRVREFEESVESHVKEQPVKSLLVAAGIGFLLGAFITRR